MYLGEQAGQKADAAKRVVFDGLEDARQDAADTQDLAVQQQYCRRAQSDKEAAE